MKKLCKENVREDYSNNEVLRILKYLDPKEYRKYVLMERNNSIIEERDIAKIKISKIKKVLNNIKNFW